MGTIEQFVFDLVGEAELSFELVITRLQSCNLFFEASRQQFRHFEMAVLIQQRAIVEFEDLRILILDCGDDDARLILWDDP